MIQKESDLTAFKKLFGEYRNAQKGIYAVASELGETIARDKFYQTLLDDSKRIAAAIKQGNPDVIKGQIGRPIFFKNYNDAVVNLPNQESTLKTLLELVLLGDLVSINLAAKLTVDPNNIDTIEKLKKLLGE